MYLQQIPLDMIRWVADRVAPIKRTIYFDKHEGTIVACEKKEDDFSICIASDGRTKLVRDITDIEEIRREFDLSNEIDMRSYRDLSKVEKMAEIGVKIGIRAIPALLGTPTIFEQLIDYL